VKAFGSYASVTDILNLMLPLVKPSMLPDAAKPSPPIIRHYVRRPESQYAAHVRAGV